MMIPNESRIGAINERLSVKRRDCMRESLLRMGEIVRVRVVESGGCFGMGVDFLLQKRRI